MEIPIMGYMGGCQNYGPFLGTLNIRVPYYNRDPKRDHNFDNHPHDCSENQRLWLVVLVSKLLSQLWTLDRYMVLMAFYTSYAPGHCSLPQSQPSRFACSKMITSVALSYMAYFLYLQNDLRAHASWFVGLQSVVLEVQTPSLKALNVSFRVQCLRLSCISVILRTKFI